MSTTIPLYDRGVSGDRSTMAAPGLPIRHDDFGAGFVSLPFLVRLIPDYIKIDRSAIVKAASDEKFAVFLKNLVVAIGQYAKIGIIAEGIENETEMRIAQSLGVLFVQGYLTGRPQTM